MNASARATLYSRASASTFSAAAAAAAELDCTYGCPTRLVARAHASMLQSRDVAEGRQLL